MYKIIFEFKLEKFLSKIPKKDATAIFVRIKALAHEPRPRWVEKMRQRPGYRIAIGNYRVIYSVDDKLKVIDILDIGDRKEIYRKK